MDTAKVFQALVASDQPTPTCTRSALPGALPLTVARAVGNGAGAPSFELGKLAQQVGVPYRTFSEGSGPDGIYVTHADFPTEREARMAERVAKWFVAGVGGQVFGR